MADRLFTYGSLMPGGQYAHLLTAANGHWQSATILGYLDADGWGHTTGYPALVLNQSGTLVQGMLLTANNLSSLWPELDEFEGSAYQRVETRVNLTNSSTVLAWVYTLAPKLVPAQLK